MPKATTTRRTARGTKTPPDHRMLYGLTSMCEVCEKPIVAGQTWKYTPSGGKVHYYCVRQNPYGEPAGFRKPSYGYSVVRQTSELIGYGEKGEPHYGREVTRLGDRSKALKLARDIESTGAAVEVFDETRHVRIYPAVENPAPADFWVVLLEHDGKRWWVEQRYQFTSMGEASEWVRGVLRENPDFGFVLAERIPGLPNRILRTWNVPRETAKRIVTIAKAESVNPAGPTDNKWVIQLFGLGYIMPFGQGGPKASRGKAYFTKDVTKAAVFTRSQADAHIGPGSQYYGQGAACKLQDALEGQQKFGIRSNPAGPAPAAPVKWVVTVTDSVILPGRKAESFERRFSVTATSAAAARRRVAASGISGNRIVGVERAEGNPAGPADFKGELLDMAEAFGGEVGSRTMKIATSRGWVKDAEQGREIMAMAHAIAAMDPAGKKRTVHLAEALQYQSLEGLRMVGKGYELGPNGWELGKDTVPGRNLAGPDSGVAKRARAIDSAMGRGVANPAGPTISQAMAMAKAAGARIGDTSGFEPWLKKAKLEGRSPMLREKLRAEFWEGVEVGESPASSSSEQDYHGVRIWKTAEGWKTNLDPDSAFDDVRQVQKFVDAQRRNPEVTDRALRYRANSPDRRPPEPQCCAFCGSTRNVEVGHLDGHEENSDPQNLIWNCRSCNTKLGLIFKTLGIGRRTRQYNPATSGANSYRQWVLAVTSMKGESDAMTVPAAVEMIRATPAEDRSRFSREIWRMRRAHWGDSGRFQATQNPGVAGIRAQYLKLIERYAYAHESRKLARMNATHEALEKFETKYNLDPNSRRDAISYLKRTHPAGLSLQHALDSIDDFYRNPENADTPRFVAAEDDWPVGAIKWTIVDTQAGTKVPQSSLDSPTGVKTLAGGMWVRTRTREAAERIADKLNRKERRVA